MKSFRQFLEGIFDGGDPNNYYASIGHGHDRNAREWGLANKGDALWWWKKGKLKVKKLKDKDARTHDRLDPMFDGWQGRFDIKGNMVSVRSPETNTKKSPPGLKQALQKKFGNNIAFHVWDMGEREKLSARILESNEIRYRELVQQYGADILEYLTDSPFNIGTEHRYGRIITGNFSTLWSEFYIDPLRVATEQIMASGDPASRVRTSNIVLIIKSEMVDFFRLHDIPIDRKRLKDVKIGVEIKYEDGAFQLILKIFGPRVIIKLLEDHGWKHWSKAPILSNKSKKWWQNYSLTKHRRIPGNIEKHNIRATKYREENREEINQRRRSDRKEDPERFRSQAKTSYNNNIERYKAYGDKYREENRDKERARQQKYRDKGITYR